MMLAALTLIEASDTTRDLYLFDTFAGMVRPSSTDRRAEDEASAADLLEEADRSTHVWAVASLEEVRAAMTATNYPLERVHLSKGESKRPCPRTRPSRLLSFAWIPTGTSPRSTS
jgi:O-methyltransferase